MMANVTNHKLTIDKLPCTRPHNNFSFHKIIKKIINNSWVGLVTELLIILNTTWQKHAAVGPAAKSKEAPWHVEVAAAARKDATVATA